MNDKSNGEAVERGTVSLPAKISINLKFRQSRRAKRCCPADGFAQFTLSAARFAFPKRLKKIKTIVKNRRQVRLYPA